MSDLKTAKQILSDITGYTVDELTERNTEPLLQAEDCLTAMYCFLAQMQANGVTDNHDQALPIQRVNGWLDFESNKELFNEEAQKNCLCKFEDGTVIRYDEEHPMEIMTHFKLAEACR